MKICPMDGIWSKALIYQVGQKVCLVFFHKMALVVLSCLTSFETILLDCIVTALISACILKNLSKMVNFCAAILILQMEENMQHFQCVMLYYFKKGKNTTETQTKKICAVYGEGAVTDRMCQKWFVKFLGTIDILAK